jgi:hypothetical protein
MRKPKYRDQEFDAALESLESTKQALAAVAEMQVYFRD